MKKPILAAAALSALSFIGSASSAAEPEAGPDEIAGANNAFSVDLYQGIKGRPGNLFFSPYSISSALAMTYAGADGETAAQMRKVLYLPEGDAAHAGFGALSNALRAAERGGVEISIANALWLQSTFVLGDEFLKSTQAHYDAALTPVDFSDAAAASGVINRWVDEQTKGKIKDLVPADAITPMTRLILTNAIYFKGDWAKAFKVDWTRDLPFHLEDGSTAPVAMMAQEEEFRFAAADGIKILEMPYLSGGADEGSDAAKRITELGKLIAEKREFMTRARFTKEGLEAALAEIRAWEAELEKLQSEHGNGADRLSMVILLPDAKDGLAALEKNLTADNLAAWIAAAEERGVRVTIPKWKLEAQLDLSSVLRTLGMSDAFSTSDANFSKMSAMEGLYLTDALHKAFVEVNEKGTEAAAATALVAGTLSIAEPDPEFVADHPFVFLIRDQQTGAILFMGRVADPR